MNVKLLEKVSEPNIVMENETLESHPAEAETETSGVIEEILETPAPALTTPAPKIILPKPSSYSATRPKSVTAYSSDDLSFDSTFFRVVLFGETNMRKTSIAATIGDPLSTLIINTRAAAQMLPLKGKGYQIMDVKDADGLRFGLLSYATEWAIRQKENPKLQELKTIILDDATEGVQLLLEEGESKDNRKNYGDAGKELRAILTSLRHKPLNLCIVALAKSKENAITNKDKISFELPPSMLSMISAEMEFAFYILPETYKLLTDRDWLTFKYETDGGKESTYRVEIFAKSKFPMSMKGTLQKQEDPNLAAIWQKIQTAAGQASLTGNGVGMIQKPATIVGTKAPSRFGGKK